nr:MAG TPA: hypothetical protein [Caudoviricetes sp.]
MGLLLNFDKNLISFFQFNIGHYSNLTIVYLIYILIIKLYTYNRSTNPFSIFFAYIIFPTSNLTLLSVNIPAFLMFI